MFGWTLAVFAAVALAAVLKLMSREASDIKRGLAARADEDPIVNLFAWIDRVTSRRQA